MLAIVIPLSVVAAFLYALSDFLEQRAAQRNVEEEQDAPGWGVARRLAAAVTAAGRTLRRLTRDRWWLAGWAAGTSAYFVQAVALHLGSVSVVQSLQVTSLLFTLPLSTVGQPDKPRARDWGGGGAVVAGLIVFLAARGGAPGAEDAHRGRLLVMVVVGIGAVLVVAAIAALRTGPLRATLLACAAGASFAGSATLVKLTSDDLLDKGIVGTATDWPGYALAVVSVLGVVLQQVAFASGRLPVAATAMIVINPVIGTMIAIVGFSERLPDSPFRLAGLAAGAAVVVVGVAVLAHSPLLTDRRPVERERATAGLGRGG